MFEHNEKLFLFLNFHALKCVWQISCYPERLCSIFGGPGIQVSVKGNFWRRVRRNSNWGAKNYFSRKLEYLSPQTCYIASLGSIWKIFAIHICLSFITYIFANWPLVKSLSAWKFRNKCFSVLKHNVMVQAVGKGLDCESLPNSLPLSLLFSFQLSLPISHPLSLPIDPPLFLSYFVSHYSLALYCQYSLIIRSQPVDSTNSRGSPPSCSICRSWFFDPWCPCRA